MRLISAILILLSSTSYATPSQDAVNAAARAFYEYEHWNDDVNRFLQHYEKQLTPRQKQIGGYIYEILNVLNRREVRFTWRFP